MNIEIYALCHQEAKILPYFMRHYNQYGHVFLFESPSTDGTHEMAEIMGATTIPIETGGQVRDDVFTDVKNNCWKQSTADWVIICDMDEFVYHPNMLEYLATLDDTIIVPQNYEMFSDVFPTTQGQIYEEVNMGFKYNYKSGTKMFMFKPKELTEINYGHGSHHGDPKGNVKINFDSEIIAMHFKHLSLDYVLERNKYLWARMSDINKRNGWGWHVGMPAKNTIDYIEEHKKNLVKVV